MEDLAVKPRRFSYDKLASMTQLLMSKPRTALELACVAKVSDTGARNWINALHRAGCLHVKCYVDTPRSKIGSRVFAWGEGEDAPRPEPLSAIERHYRSRNKATTLQRAWRAQP